MDCFPDVLLHPDVSRRLEEMSCQAGNESAQKPAQAHLFRRVSPRNPQAGHPSVMEWVNVRYANDSPLTIENLFIEDCPSTFLQVRKPPATGSPCRRPNRLPTRTPALFRASDRWIFLTPSSCQ